MAVGNYDGGKGNIYQHLINRIPPHDVFVEPFLGGGAVLKHKRPARVNVGIDLDETAVADWRAYIAENGDAPASSDTAMVMSAIEDGGRGWFILRADAFDVLPRLARRPGTFVYADPPYPGWMRSSDRPMYQYEMMDRKSHMRLLRLLRSLDCMMMVSSYWSELYAEMLAGWETAVIPTTTRSGRDVEEWAWMNYPKPQRLHDYRYLGEDFRERERIKRKRQRWVSNFADMSVLERRAFLAVVKREGLLW